MNEQVARARLEEERVHVSEELAAVRFDAGVTAPDATLATYDREGQDDVDVASVTVDREMARSIDLDLRSQLDEIDAALHRLDAGRYGLCASCAQPIAEERLDSLPWARLCIDHAKVAEYRDVRVLAPDAPAYLLAQAHDSDDEDGIDPDEAGAEEDAVHLR